MCYKVICLALYDHLTSCDQSNKSDRSDKLILGGSQRMYITFTSITRSQRA